MRINLLSETLHEMEKNNLTENDVLYVNIPEDNIDENGKYIIKNNFIDFNTFKEKANYMYNNGYGLVEVNPGTVIMFTKGVMYRETYDGCEYWKYIEFYKDINFKERDIPSIKLWI